MPHDLPATCDVQWARVATACDGEDDGLELDVCLILGTLTPIFTARLQASIRYSDIGRETIFNTGYIGHDLLGDGVYRIKLQRENTKQIQLRNKTMRDTFLISSTMWMSCPVL
jgi:hypothetical protein